MCHKAPSDQIHDSFSASCNECHNIYKWYPSTFDHSTYFVLDNDHNVSCKTCHVKSETKQYSCYGCHEHSAGKIDEEHREHGIYQFENCIKCHKSGNKHEAFEGEEGNNKKEVGHSKEKSEHGEDDD
ncbi:MAG: hypothetical protein IPH84_04120 [Bacteroidales bacterium]|nr:hypothetical protein [Bacteroidales bacterium]